MVARNVNRDLKESGTVAPRTKPARAITQRDLIEDAPCAKAWQQFRNKEAPQMDLEPSLPSSAQITSARTFRPDAAQEEWRQLRLEAAQES